MGETEHRKERLMQGQSLIYDRTVWHNIKYYKAIAYYLQLAGLEVEESFMPEWLGKSEIDIYLPALHLGMVLISHLAMVSSVGSWPIPGMSGIW